MDAQNAAQSDQTKPAGASPRRDSPSSPAPAPVPAPGSPRRASPVKDPKASTTSTTTTTTTTTTNAITTATSSLSAPAADDRDSDAETIVLPGKDGHSPSKARKVRQEDKSDGDGDTVSVRPPAPFRPSGGHDGERLAVPRRSGDGVKKRHLSGHPRNKDGSSGLSSAPASPPQNQHQRRRRSDDSPSSSDSECSHHKSSSKAPSRDKLRPGERQLSHKRKAPKADSDDEADARKPRRQRTTSASGDPIRPHREHKSVSSARPHHDSRNRSPSPHVRLHRRSISTQLPSQSSNGFSQRKRRLPAPLQATDYHSDESSASGSPHPRGAKLRSLTTPATADSNASPAKMAPHKKHLDAHGQTFLARACARCEYEVAKQRLGERPEDLNVADYAGNTPLQIAAINGCEDIVKLLIDAGCNLDCVNYDKDTPLLDAVDNGHLGVVKLLLDAGVNPRKANVNGQEPIDRVSDDTENADEIRAALVEAKKRAGERRRTSEDHHSHQEHHDARDSRAPESPRNSPATTAPGTGRRSGTVRSTKTRNDLLYMPLDDKTLRQAAGRGDEETVARILQVKEGYYDDPESMVAAARGGHDLVIQLLLGLGGANPDPGPVSSLSSDFGTPILAAIGQENIKVLELLLEQQAFDPTRRFKGETYYEIARRRQGTNWKEEEHMLKNAYDEHKRNHKDSVKTKSPARRERDRERDERETKRTKREDAKDEARAHKRNLSSPSRDMESRKRVGSSKLSSPKEKKRSDSFANHGDEHMQKRGPGRPKKEDRVPSINISDRELSPTMSHKQPKAKRTESDAAGVSSEGETVKPRRKLVSKGELRGEREKQRRASMASTASLKDPPSPHDTRHDEASDKHRSDRLSERYHDRTKALKRDESRDRLSVTSDGGSKRHRASVTPDRPSNGEKDDGEAPVKRRRLDGEGKEKRPKHTATSDERSHKPSRPHDSSNKHPTKESRRTHDEDPPRQLQRRESARSSGSDRSIHVKAEEIDVDMQDAESLEVVEETDAKAARDKEEQEKKRKATEQEEAKKKEDERRRLEAEERRRREQEEARKREEEKEKQRKEEEEREAERRRKEEEDRQHREEEKQRKEAEEKARREEEEKRRVDEKKKKEEEERRREEEDRIHREQIEREAAEEARRKREEDEKKEQERRERAHIEEMERKRVLREEEEERRLFAEQEERLRLDKLPPLLRWLDSCPDPKSPVFAEKFKQMHGVRYDTIQPSTSYTAAGREQWLLNTHVALLLGEKDLDLTRYSGWERMPVSVLAKKSLWRIEWKLYSLVDPKVWDLGRQLPGHYGGEEPSHLRFQTKEQLKSDAWERFLGMDLFFVKASDFLYTVPHVPHLREVKLAVGYHELLATEQAQGWKTLQKWKHDPDASRYHGFAPRNKYYINGVMVGEDKAVVHQTSKTPFSEKRVPRRGLLQVYPDDPDYASACIEQGLEHLLNGHQSPPLRNGLHSSPISQKSVASTNTLVNGTNGHPGYRHTSAGATTNGDLPNGIHGSPT